MRPKKTNHPWCCNLQSRKVHCLAIWLILLLVDPEEHQSSQTKKKQKKTSSWEATSYLSDLCLQEDTDPLRFWEQSQASMPMLSKLAQNYLVVPATLAPVERLANVAGPIFKSDRCQLSDKTFQSLVIKQTNKRKTLSSLFFRNWYPYMHYVL